MGVTRKSLQAESQRVLTSTQGSLFTWEQTVLKQNKQKHYPTLPLNKLWKVSDWKKKRKTFVIFLLLLLFAFLLWMLHMGCFLPCSQSQSAGLHEISEVKKRHAFAWSWGLGEGKWRALKSEIPVFPIPLGVLQQCLTNCKYLMKTCYKK